MSTFRLRMRFLHASIAVISLITVLFFCLWNIGYPSMRSHDESYHTKVIQEMHWSGDWIRLTMNGQPYFGKPPLKMWLTSIPLWLFGESNFSYRLLDGLAGAGTIIVTFLLALRLGVPLLAAWLSAFLLIASRSFLFDCRVRYGTQDSLLVFLISLAMYIAWDILQLLPFQDAETRRTLQKKVLVFSLLTGLAVCTKSAAGLLPAIVLVVHLLMEKKLFALLKLGLPVFVLATLVLLIPPGIYFVPRSIADPLTWHYVLGYDLKDRLLTTGFHRGPWYVYIAAIFRRGYIVNSTLAVLTFGYAMFTFGRPVHRFLFIWFLIPVAGFSLFKSRVEYYIAPAYPPFAILASILITTLFTAAGAAYRLALSGSRIAQVRTAAIVALLVLATYKTGIQLSKNTDAVLYPEPKLMFEIAATRIREQVKGDKQAQPSVLLYNLPWDLGPRINMRRIRNAIYLGFLHPYATTTGSIEELREFAERPGTRYVIAPVEEKDLILQSTNPASVEMITPGLFGVTEKPGMPIRWVAVRYN